VHRIRDSQLSTEFVHNHVDRVPPFTQTRSTAKGLH
jgi:hypothetical protein